MLRLVTLVEFHFCLFSWRFSRVTVVVVIVVLFIETRSQLNIVHTQQSSCQEKGKGGEIIIKTGKMWESWKINGKLSSRYNLAWCVYLFVNFYCSNGLALKPEVFRETVLYTEFTGRRSRNESGK
jgi:hypothetical protein